jgi:hypothetical protein
MPCAQALDSVTNANGILTIDNAKQCLTSRAKCYLAMSDHKNAYLDAERSLEDDPNFVKGIHMKVRLSPFKQLIALEGYPQLPSAVGSWFSSLGLV